VAGKNSYRSSNVKALAGPAAYLLALCDTSWTDSDVMIPDSDNVSREGFVYVLSNPAISGLIKIGRSERHPSYRVAELSRATGVPEPFVLEYWERVVDCAAAEALIHSRLSPVQV